MTDEYKKVFELVQKTFYKEDGKMVSQRWADAAKCPPFLFLRKNRI